MKSPLILYWVRQYYISVVHQPTAFIEFPGRCSEGESWVYKCLETYINGKMTDGRKWRPLLKVLCKSRQCCYAECGCWRSFVKVIARWVTLGRQWKKGRRGTADCQNNNIILFKHGHKSFSMSTLEKDRWMPHSFYRIRSQKGSSNLINRELNMSDIESWFIYILLLFIYTVLLSRRQGFDCFWLFMNGRDALHFQLLLHTGRYVVHNPFCRFISLWPCSYIQ